MMGWGNEWGMPFFGLGPLLFILIIGGIIAYLARRGRNSSGYNGPTARDILDRRYASGGITKDQYEQMKREISH